MRLPDNETAYTRDGQFAMDANRQIVTSNGYPLIWSGQIPVDTQDIRIEYDGSVMIMVAGVWSQAGSIETTTFPNPEGLLSYGQSLWLENEVSGTAQSATPGTTGYGPILGNAVEQSNVNLAEDMARMVSLQRSFEMSVRAFQQTDTMLAQAIRMRRG